MVSFQCDRQCTDIPFRDMYPTSYEVTTQKDAVVKKYQHRNRWNLVFENRLSRRANKELERLRLDLTQQKPEDDKDNCLVWRWDKKSSFSVRSTYKYILVNAGSIWNVKCPLKYKAFLQMIAKRAILTWPMFKKRGWSGLNVCVFCHRNEETIEHLLLNCDYTIQI